MNDHGAKQRTHSLLFNVLYVELVSFRFLLLGSFGNGKLGAWRKGGPLSATIDG